MRRSVRRLHSALPDPAYRYFLPLAILIILTGTTYIGHDILGLRNPVVGGVLYLAYILLLLASAWLGYFPGLLILLSLTILSRFLDTTPRTFSHDAIRYFLGAVICVLLSRLGQTSRRREAELKQTTDELETRVRERTESLRIQTNLLDQVNDAVLTLDKNFHVQYFNAAAEQLFGWSSSEARDQPYSAVAGTVVTELERRAIHAEIMDRGAWNGEIICTNRAGKRFLVHVSWSVLHDNNGNPTAVIGIHRDLSAPKQMEQALRESEDRLKLAESALSLGTWELDLNSESVRCSEQLLQLYGISEQRPEMGFGQWLRLVHPDDRPNDIGGAKVFFQRRESFERQLRIIWPNGSVHWLHSKSRVILNESGQADRVIGVDFDITEHKQSEERLRILSSAVEQCPVSILITNLNDEIEYVNARLTESTGYAFEELKGRHPRVLSAAMPPEHFQEVAKALQTGQWHGVVRTTRKNGELFWESVVARPIRDPQGRPTHVIAVAEDITQRLQMESALKLSEERFRIAAESSGDAIYEWDLGSDLVTILGAYHAGSEAFRLEVPWRHEEFRRRFYHPEDRERVERALERNLADGEPFSQEFRVVLPSGEIRYYADRGSPVRDATGRPYKWIGVSRDTTEQKKVERANAQLASIVENADAAIVSKDLSGVVLTWNRGAQRIYGYSAEEMIGRTVAALIPPDRIAENTVFMERLRRGECVRHVETTRVTKSGEPIPVLLTLSPMQDRQGNFLGIAHVAEDITHIKQLERQLAQTQKMESIGQLASGIAHEINTPIQYIGDNATFLNDAFRDLVKFAEARGIAADRESLTEGVALPTPEALDEGIFDYLRLEVPKAIEQLLGGVEHVARIVLAMKDFSHPGEVEKTPLDINRAIESTILVSKNEWKYVADLSTDFDSDLPAVPCIAGEFNQVILNLIVNAAHAISDVVKNTGAMGSIRITTRQDGEVAEIRVSDTGCGIPKANQSKVFDPFFTTKPVGKGTGQGLAIAYGVIVNKHGGTIQLDSEAGCGTTFIIRLPLVLEEEMV